MTRCAESVSAWGEVLASNDGGSRFASVATDAAPLAIIRCSSVVLCLRPLAANISDGNRLAHANGP